jgi:hypothetical protein
MIISNALKRLFVDAKADCTFLGTLKPNTAIKYWYGDQSELIEWISQRKTLENYPLVWYVKNEYIENDGWYSTNARLVIMQDTKLKVLNDWRTQNSYEGILEPVWQSVKKILTKSQFVQIDGKLEDRTNRKHLLNRLFSDRF